MSIDQFKSLVSQKNGIARPNLFRVQLPALPGASTSELNILCKDVVLPGRQIMTTERTIGLKRAKIPYGYAVDDVSMTFHVLNDYGVKEYFEAWQSLAVNQNTYEVGYQRGGNGYGKRVVIEQLRKVDKTPGLSSLFSTVNNQQMLDLFYSTSSGSESIKVYECELIDAFPTTMNAINLTNELDGIIELNIQLSYTDWKDRTFASATSSSSRSGTIFLNGTTFKNLVTNTISNSINNAISRGINNIIGSIF